jgi:hypothetical protein
MYNDLRPASGYSASIKDPLRTLESYQKDLKTDLRLRIRAKLSTTALTKQGRLEADAINI